MVSIIDRVWVLFLTELRQPEKQTECGMCNSGCETMLDRGPGSSSDCAPELMLDDSILSYAHFSEVNWGHIEIYVYDLTR